MVVAAALVIPPRQCHADAAMEMLQRALRATEQVQDYTATVAVTVDSPSLQIPRRTAKVYFKQPDMINVEATGLMVIPRDALMLGNLSEHLERYATASFIGSGTLDGRPVRSIKLSPRESGGRGGRVLLWIDTERHLLLKSEIWRENERRLSVNFRHARVAGHYWMPERIVAEMSPGAITRRDEGGRVEIVFSNYRVNTGLADSIFKGSN